MHIKNGYNLDTYFADETLPIKDSLAGQKSLLVAIVFEVKKIQVHVTTSLNESLGWRRDFSIVKFLT